MNYEILCLMIFINIETHLSLGQLIGSEKGQLFYSCVANFLYCRIFYFFIFIVVASLQTLIFRIIVLVVCIHE